MRNIDLIDKEIQPLHSEVLIAIEDTFDIKTSKGGILMANAAHEEAEADSAGYTLSDWIIRYGTVARLPRMINKAGYDWKTELEIGEGDIVFWNISRAFRNPVLKTLDGNLYTLINYHEIHAKKKREEITPVNGFCLFRNIKKEKVYFEYEFEEPSEWWEIVKMGREVEYDYAHMNYKREFKEGDVCILSVPPFRLYSHIDGEEELFVAQTRHIVLTK